MTREQAKAPFIEAAELGWLNFIDIIFDNCPEQIEITCVFQKWAGLKVDYHGEDEYFEELLDRIYYLSQYCCEKCGKSGRSAIIDGWEMTLCDTHYEEIDVTQKYRADK